jgi:hypothetical protein
MELSDKKEEKKNDESEDEDDDEGEEDDAEEEEEDEEAEVDEKERLMAEDGEERKGDGTDLKFFTPDPVYLDIPGRSRSLTLKMVLLLGRDMAPFVEKICWLRSQSFSVQWYERVGKGAETKGILEKGILGSSWKPRSNKKKPYGQVYNSWAVLGALIDWDFELLDRQISEDRRVKQCGGVCQVAKK